MNVGREVNSTLGRSDVSQHKFKVGEAVRIVVSTDLRQAVKRERFRVLRQLPETPTGEPSYRVKGESEGFERLVGEREIASF
jgi:hypothetical protein